MAVGTSAFPTSLDTVVELIEAANNSTTTLDGAITDSDVTITVASTSTFPSSGTISIDSEIISYTGKSGTTFTGCTRGFESTSAASHSNGATVNGYITAKHHNVLASALIAAQTKLGYSSSTATSGTVLRGTGTGTSAWGAVVNADISASAAIAYSKLNLTGSIVNADVSASAAIAYSKLNLTGSVTNADLAGSIALSKLSITGTPDGTKFLRDDGSWQAVAGGGGGSVTSVGLSMPAIFTVTNSPVTSSGTLTATLATQTANTVWAGPTSGGAATPTFRALVSGDIPDLSSTYATAAHTHSSLTNLYINGTAGSGYLEMRPQASAPVSPGAGFAFFADSTGRFSWIRAADGFIRKFDATLTADRVYTLPDVSGTIITSGNLSSITTTGTITSGTWNGSVIGSSYGGAGTVTGILKANGSGTVSAAVSGTDYAPATSGSAILKGNGSGGFSSAVSGTDYAPATSGSSILKGSGTGGFSSAVAGTDYEVPLTFSTGLTRTTNTITVNTTQNIAKLSNLTSNGFVKTSGSDGTLSVDTNTYLTATSPQITTSITTDSATFALLNTTATTINFGGAATTLNMAGGSGAVINLGGGVNAAELRFLEPSGSGTNYTAIKAQAQAGNITYTLPASITNGYFLQTDGSGNLSWAAAGGGLTIGTTAITSGTAGRILYETSGNVVGEIAGSSVDANGAVQFAATARSSGVAQYFRLNTPADTGQTTATESVGAYFGGNGSGSTVTRTWAAGTVTTQRENVFVAPTYAGASATATFTTAATVAITGEPAVGANAAITNPIALYVGGRTGINTTAPAAQTHIVSGAAARVALRVDSAATPSVNIFETTVNGTAGSGFVVTSTGAPSSPIPTYTGTERYGAGNTFAASSATNTVLFGTNNSINTTGNADKAVLIGQNIRISGSTNITNAILISPGGGSANGVQISVNRDATNTIAIGSWGIAPPTYTGDTVLIGSGNTGGSYQGQNSVIIGTNLNYPQGPYSLSLMGVSDGPNYGMAVGYNAHNSATGGISWGVSSTVASGHTGSIALGAEAATTGANQLAGGSGNYPLNDLFFGKGVTHATPTAYTINGTGGSGADIAGAAVNIAGGKGTGTGIPGTIGMQFARAGSTSSTLNTLSDEWRASYSTTDTVTLAANIKTSTTALTSAAAINALWTTATHASRTSAITLSTVDNAASLAERWRLSTNGAGTGVSTTTTGFFGGTNVTGMVSENITLNTGGTTTDSTIDLPANSIILSVTGRVTTTITTATDWKLGDATIADRFSDANATLTSGTTTVGINQWKADRTTAGQGPYQASTAKVRVTTTGTPGAGAIRITIHYITLSAPTS